MKNENKFYLFRENRNFEKNVFDLIHNSLLEIFRVFHCEADEDLLLGLADEVQQVADGAFGFNRRRAKLLLDVEDSGSASGYGRVLVEYLVLDGIEVTKKEKFSQWKIFSRNFANSRNFPELRDDDEDFVCEFVDDELCWHSSDVKSFNVVVGFFVEQHF